MILAGTGLVEVTLPAADRIRTAAETAAACEALLARRAAASKSGASGPRGVAGSGVTATATSSFNSDFNRRSEQLPGTQYPRGAGPGAQVDRKKTAARDDEALRRFKKSLH
jgi:hypothetical protein